MDQLNILKRHDVSWQIKEGICRPRLDTLLRDTMGKRKEITWTRKTLNNLFNLKIIL